MFGSYGWHHFFSRLFLVYGIWPGEWVEGTPTGKPPDQPADVGKVFGVFVSSAFVHSFAAWTVHGGNVEEGSGEARFFAGCGLAVIIKELVKRLIIRSGRDKEKEALGAKVEELVRWYDGILGRIWWIGILLYVGSNFARGWYVFLLGTTPTFLYSRTVSLSFSSH